MNDKLKNTTTESGHHYYATCALGWKTAPTRDEAIKGLVKAFRSDFTRMVKAQHKEGSPGAYVWSCKVHAPADAHYRINFYQPEGVETSDHQEHSVTYVTTKEVAYCRDWKQVAQNAQAALKKLAKEHDPEVDEVK